MKAKCKLRLVRRVALGLAVAAIAAPSAQAFIPDPASESPVPRTWDVGAGPEDMLSDSGLLSRPAPAERVAVTTAGVFPGLPYGVVVEPAAAVHPDSRFGRRTVGAIEQPAGQPADETFEWTSTSIGVVAGLGAALVASLAGIAILRRRNHLAQA
jgi:hypothetical protein